MHSIRLICLTIALTACSDSSLKTFNAEPTATINSHIDGAEILEEPTTTLFGKVADSDHDASELTVNWYVNTEPACEDQTPEDDGHTACEVTLSTGTANILLEVSDPKNASGNDTVIVSVNPTEPPEVDLISPHEGGLYQAGEPIDFRGYVMDEEDGIDVTVWLESDIQGMLEISPTLDSDGDFSTYGTLIEGAHIITLKAEDSTGKQGEESHLVEVLPANEAPSIDSVEITPDPATAVDALSCAYTGFTDPDGDADASHYEWFINDVSTGTGDSLSEGYVKGDAVTCTVTPNDGTIDGESVSDTITIDNAQPTIDAVEISPVPATTTDGLSCAYTGFEDADGDADASRFEWQINGVSAGSGASLAAGYVGGDAVTCTVTPNDGTEDGAPISETIIIGNTGPEMTSVEISPDVGITAETVLTCTATASDADGESLSIDYSWDIDGVAAGTTDTLDLFGTGAISGQTITCTATATDGDGETDTGTDSVLIENSLPVIDSVTLSPAEVYTNDTITATVSASDPEGDGISLSYAWYVNDALVTWPSSSISGVDFFDKHDEVYVIVTPDDGTESGDAVASATITVLNTPPTAPVVSIEVEESCPEGWSLMNDGARCVQLFEIDSSSWYTASDDCFDQGGTLVSILSLEDNDQVMGLGVGLVGNTIWIGYNDIDAEGAWAWEAGESVSFERWRTGGGEPPEPNGGTVENCVEMYHADAEWSDYVSYWNDAPCDSSGHNGGYACQIDASSSSGLVQWRTDEGGNGHWYAIRSSSSITWSEAQSSAEEEGGHLVTLTSAEENTWVYDTFLTDTSVWMMGEGHARGPYIGLYETEGAFEWVTGESADYFSWVPGDPNGTGPDDVGSYYNYSPSTGLEWSDEDFTSVGTHYIVEWSESPDGLVCTIVTESTDEDGDAIDYTFEWDVDGAAYTDTETTTWPDDTVPEASLGSDELWTCEVTPNDGDEDGESDTADYLTEAACDGADASCPADSCLQILDDGYSTGTGYYWLDPDGLGAFEAYCDMQTDGGGWTVVGRWGNYSGYAMRDFEDGRDPELVRDTMLTSASHPSSGPVHYGLSVMNALFNNGESEYLSLTGTRAGGYILVRFTKDAVDADYDAFRGVYDTWYMQENAFTAVHMKDGLNGNPLPLSTVSWASVAISARYLAPDELVDNYHYLPDDVTDANEWLFRENLDDIPAREISDSSNVPSLLLIR